MPRLDLSKVKPYEEHLREKQAAKEAAKQKEKEKNTTYMTKSSSNNPKKSQMSTIQHGATKVNNFLTGDIPVKITDYAKREKNVSHSLELSPNMNSYKVK